MTIDSTRSLLDLTLEAASKDIATTTIGGVPLAPGFLEGQSFRPASTIRDERGNLREIFDSRWEWSSEPYSQGYVSVLKPGVCKGWALHKLHQDRYFVLSGEVMVVTFDPRPDSATYGQINKTILTAEQPGLFNVPKFVWHADWNIGGTDAAILNLPTAPYDHANPDKYRLPLDTELIPFDFGGAKGW